MAEVLVRKERTDVQPVGLVNDCEHAVFFEPGGRSLKCYHFDHHGICETDVDKARARRYYDVDREANMLLCCTAVPETDLRVRVCQYDAMLNNRAEHELPPGRTSR